VFAKRSRLSIICLTVMIMLIVGTVASSAAERTGAWVDDIVVIEETREPAAIEMLLAGEIDIYAQTMSDPELLRVVESSPELTYSVSYGGYTDLTFNPCGPIFSGTGKLNPFAVPRIREAMNLLIDRDYICQEIYGGMAIPRIVVISGAMPDYARHADAVRALELKYQYDFETAKAIVAEEMTKLGAKLVNGLWNYNGEPVTLTGVIRIEDERLEIGDYFAAQLEDIGFTVNRLYKTSAEANPIWLLGDPNKGEWNFATGGWSASVINRDYSIVPEQMYTRRIMPYPLWQNYNPDPALDEACKRLYYCDFSSMEERAELWGQVLELTLKDSVRIWVADTSDYVPRRTNVTVAADLAAAVAGAQLWPFTIRFNDKVGGTMKIGIPSVLTSPWNPIAGSNWVYDNMLTRGTADRGVMYDPFTGLTWPQRIDRAEVVALAGLPISRTHDWVDLEFVDSIEVPADAWADWDAAAQRFITVAEKFPEGTTANLKSVVYYPSSLYETKWHDGSKFSIADVLFYLITSFDRAKPESALYDESAVADFSAFIEYFKGVRIVSTDPLIIETYTDSYNLDAELCVSTWYPIWSYGSGAWHNLGLAARAEANRQAAFSQGKANQLGVEQISMVAGPTINVLARNLTEAAAEGYIPYAKFLSQYISDEEVSERWSNLKKWYSSKGHFWVASGPFYIEKAYPVEGMIHLKRFADYPDPSTKWDIFGEPMIPEVDIDGPARIKGGIAATFDVYVSFNDEPYATEYIDMVTFMVLNSAGEIVVSGEAEVVEEGLWQVELSAEDTAKLGTGASRLEVIVSSNMVSIPTFESMQFASLK
jgi:peptide/nickel transport system substrate-binding protein